MRILYHHRTQARDGGYVHIVELQEALRRRGHEIVEVSPAAGRPAGFRQGGVRAGSLPGSLREALEWGYNALSYARLQRAVLATAPDVIYERYALGNVAGVFAARRFGLPLLLEVNAPLAQERQSYGGLAFPRVARRLERFVFRAADRVLPVTETLRGLLIAEGVDPARSVVIPNGVSPSQLAFEVDTEAAKRALGLAGATVLGFTGFFREWHRLDRVVRLLASGDPALATTHLLIVGDGPERGPLTALAGELGAADRLHITGVVGRDEIPRHAAAFDVALQPAVTAYASPLKLFEYLVLSKAVVAPDQPNIREVLTDGVDGLLVPPDDEQALNTALRRLLADPDLRARIGAAARRRVETVPYTWDRNAERVEALVQVHGA